MRKSRTESTHPVLVEKHGTSTLAMARDHRLSVTKFGPVGWLKVLGSSGPITAAPPVSRDLREHGITQRSTRDPWEGWGQSPGGGASARRRPRGTQERTSLADLCGRPSPLGCFAEVRPTVLSTCEYPWCQRHGRSCPVVLLDGLADAPG